MIDPKEDAPPEAEARSEEAPGFLAIFKGELARANFAEAFNLQGYTAP